MYTKYGVSAAEFCRVWQASESAKAAAKSLNMPVSAAMSRASSYRRQGVKLKRMGAAHRVNIAALNEIAAEK